MKSSITMLIVEDNTRHITDCKAAVEQVKAMAPIEINVIYAEDLDQAMEMLPQADVVVTDVFFPQTKGGEEVPSGKAVVEYCMEKHIPVTWTSSTYHHGPKTNAVSEWGRAHGLEMYDCYGEGNAEGEHKPWESAIVGALITMVKVEDGTIFYEDGGTKWLAPAYQREREKRYGANIVSYVEEEISENYKVIPEKFRQLFEK